MGRIPAKGLLGRRWSRSTVAVVVASVVASVAASAPASGAPADLDLAPGVPLAAGVPPERLAGLSPRLTDAQGPVSVFIELTAPAAADVFAERRRAGAPAPAAAESARGAKVHIGEVADRVLGALRARDGATRELFRTTNAIPGLAVTADAARVRELAASPEVRAVHPLVPKTLSNASTVQLTETLRVWQQTGVFGDGVRLGVIDDGVDYTHADFGGPGTSEAYEAIDRSRVDPSYFPTEKVVGGFDFAGDEYDASGASGPDALVPRPDPNPLSCGEHGTHVAGTAAGFGVNADGSTFRGDYRGLDAQALADMRIAPGTAPRALVYALKVFGCGGSTNVVSQALDWALDPNGDGDFTDHLDVVNLSLGSDYGAPDDPDSMFIGTLARHGVVSVLAAGNGGDLFDIGGSPGNAPEAIAVASTRDASVLRDGTEVLAPAGVAGVKGGQYSQSYAGFDTLDRAAPVVALSDPDNADGCLPFSGEDAAAVAGKHVWLEWDDDDATRRCGTAVRADNAAAADAAGVLLTSSKEHFVAGLAGNETVPMFQFTVTDTTALRPALEAGTLRVRLTGALRSAVPTTYPEITDTPSLFTSRDTRFPAVKPDLAAPGDTISSALNGSGDERLVISGTSMASPHAAGIAALVRQAHPEWTVEEVKAALMNTASADVYAAEGPSGPIHGPNRVGAGRVNAAAAVATPALAMVEDDPGQVSVTFGVVEVDGPLHRTKTVKVMNKSAAPLRFTAAYEPITTMPGVRYELSHSDITVPPRGVATFTVTLRIPDPVALRRTADPTIEKIQNDLPRQFLADASGRVVLTPQDMPGRPEGKDVAAVPLRVPVYSAPKPVSNIAAEEQVRFSGAEAVLRLSGRGVNQGEGDEAYRSLVSVLQLQAESGRLPECGALLVVDCTPNQTARGGDLRYVGATSTAPLAVRQGSPDQAVLAFGMSTWGNWYNLGSNTIPFVEIDTDLDGATDFGVLGTKLPGTDVLVATTIDLRSPDLPTVAALPVNGQYGDVDTGAFDNNVVVLPVPLAALGIDPAGGAAPIRYVAGVAGYYTGPADTDGVIDLTGPLLFDAARPGLWVEGGGDPALSYLALPGAGLVVHRDPVRALLQLATRLLVLLPHNATGDRTQLVRVSPPAVLPLVGPGVPLQDQAPEPVVAVPPQLDTLRLGLPVHRYLMPERSAPGGAR